MATRSLRPKGESMLDEWQSGPERAPSVLRPDTPSVARGLALTGFFLIAVGALAMISKAAGWSYIVGPAVGLVCATFGLALILYHAFTDWEPSVRRLYGFFAIVFLLIGVVLRVLPIRNTTGAWFLPYGVPLLTLGFLVALAVLRHETEVFWRALLLRLVGSLGAIMILAGVAVGLFKPDFLPGEGIVLILLGTLFVSGFIGMQSAASDAGYYAGIALGFVAVGVFFLAVLRSVTTRDYFIPAGLTLMATSCLHFALALGICSDAPFVVLTRRELAAFFYSPIAYLLLFGSTAVAGILFIAVVSFILSRAMRGAVIGEPMVAEYLSNGIPVVTQLLIVPVLTMRLLSEEKRSGTLEMLLTAPLNESSIVLAKFAAVWVFWLVLWVPYFLFLVGLRVVGGEEFDYRPLLSFGLGLCATGGGLLAMGLFFSSMSRNQIIAAVLTFVCMLTLILAPGLFDPSSPWQEIFNYASFFVLWQNLLNGDFAPRYLVVHLSATIFFLFLSVKVLEARKWK